MPLDRRNIIPAAISLLSRSICLFRSIDQSLCQKIYALNYLATSWSSSIYDARISKFDFLSILERDFSSNLLFSLLDGTRVSLISPGMDLYPQLPTNCLAPRAECSSNLHSEVATIVDQELTAVIEWNAIFSIHVATISRSSLCLFSATRRLYPANPRSLLSVHSFPHAFLFSLFPLFSSGNFYILGAKYRR